MVSSERKLNKACRNIIKALVGIPVIECISILEQTKIDIMLNRGVVKIDGKIGIIKHKDKPYIGSREI